MNHEKAADILKAIESSKLAELKATRGTDRKTIGDFACHLHAILGVRAR